MNNAEEMVINGGDLYHLQSLPSLKSLYLKGKSIGNKDLDTLKTLSQLELLALDSTSINEKGLVELENALPACEIYHQKSAPLGEYSDNILIKIIVKIALYFITAAILIGLLSSFGFDTRKIGDFWGAVFVFTLFAGINNYIGVWVFEKIENAFPDIENFTINLALFALKLVFVYTALAVAILAEKLFSFLFGIESSFNIVFRGKIYQRVIPLLLTVGIFYYAVPEKDIMAFIIGLSFLLVGIAPKAEEEVDEVETKDKKREKKKEKENKKIFLSKDEPEMEKLLAELSKGGKIKGDGRFYNKNNNAIAEVNKYGDILIGISLLSGGNKKIGRIDKYGKIYGAKNYNLSIGKIESDGTIRDKYNKFIIKIDDYGSFKNKYGN